MRDRSRGSSDEPEYDWLYGSERGGSGSDPRGSDPEPTRILPTMDRPAQGPGSRADRPSGRRQGGPLQQPPPPPRRDRPAPTTSGRPPRRRPRLGWLKLVLVLWLVFLVAVPLWAWTQVDKVRTDPGGDRPSAQPGTTYLLVGSDSREGLTRKEQLEYGTGRGDGRRTDTIMLLHTGSGPDLLMSIPRDSLVEVPGYGVTKINAAFAYGGPRLLVDTIENNTGIRIDDYVEIGFGGFVNVVDAVGGVEICPKRAMKDPQANLDIEKGCQEADGITALGYARSRKLYTQRGDIDRARAQREVVAAVGSKAASPWTVINPVRYFRLADSGSESVRVGRETSMFSAVRFAWAMTKVGGDGSLTCGVPIADLAVNWDRERADRLFRLIAEDRTDDVTKALCRQSGLRAG